MKTSAPDQVLLPKAFHTHGFEMSSTLRDSLASAIHGAFEVAVEIAVLEVTKLVSAAAGDVCDKMRQENQTLKEELQKAQSIIQSVFASSGSNCAKLATHNGDNFGKAHISNSKVQEDHTRQENAVSDSQGQDHRDDLQAKPALLDAIDSKPQTEMSHYSVKVEINDKQPCDYEDSEDRSQPMHCFHDDGAPQPLKVKLEKSEDEMISSNYSVDSFGEEAVSVILEEWTPERSHFECDEQNAPLPAPHQPQGHTSKEDFPESTSVSEPHFDHQVTNQEHQPPQIYGDLVHHNQIIAKSNPHSCRLCGQTFPVPSMLRRHYGACQRKLNQRNHTPNPGGKRAKLQLYPPGCSPFLCSYCNREFNRLENLKTHLRIHTGERPYTCSVCSKAFRHSGALTRHFRIHTGEKPYVCGLCGKSFRNASGLKFHQHSHNKQLS